MNNYEKKINKVYYINGEMHFDGYPFADHKWQYAIEYVELELALARKHEAEKLADLNDGNFMEIHPSFIEIRNEKVYCVKLY